MIESVMDHIAYELNKDPIQVRLANVESSNDTMPQIVKEMKSISEYEERKKAVEDFNSVSYFSDYAFVQFMFVSTYFL